MRTRGRAETGAERSLGPLGVVVLFGILVAGAILASADVITADLDATVRGVMAPAVMGVWLRGETR